LSNKSHISARLSLQRAFLTHVTRSLRSVSLSVSADQFDLSIQFIYDDTRTDDELELPSIVAAEVAGDWPDPARVTETILTVPAAESMTHLDWLVYHRCEDGWGNGRC
tara:strand:- start:20347 stop:20670 length:324 start_codon:yes stop_codon:yes gene_type:complete